MDWYDLDDDSPIVVVASKITDWVIGGIIVGAFGFLLTIAALS